MFGTRRRNGEAGATPSFCHARSLSTARNSSPCPWSSPYQERLGCSAPDARPPRQRRHRRGVAGRGLDALVERLEALTEQWTQQIRSPVTRRGRSRGDRPTALRIFGGPQRDPSFRIDLQQRSRQCPRAELIGHVLRALRCIYARAVVRSDTRARSNASSPWKQPEIRPGSDRSTSPTKRRSSPGSGNTPRGRVQS